MYLVNLAQCPAWLKGAFLLRFQLCQFRSCGEVARETVQALD